MKSRDLDLVLDAWTAPAPTAGFADRVMIACAAPVAAAVEMPRGGSRWGAFLAAAAVVVAMVGVPIFVAQNASAPVVAAAPTESGILAPLGSPIADLGPLQD
jgi:hypothetical protein